MISSLVVRMDEALSVDVPAHIQESLDQMYEHPQLELGEPTQHNIPIVVDCDNACDSEAVIDWIRNLAGVQQVDIVFISLDEPN